MKNKTGYFLLISFFLLICFTVIRQSSEKENTTFEHNLESQADEEVKEVPDFDQTSSGKVNDFGLLDEIRTKGPTWSDQVELFWRRFEAAGSDKNEIFPALAMFLDSRFPVSDILDISRSLLEHENRSVRFKAIYYLYLFGAADDAYSELVKILNNPFGETPEDRLSDQKGAFELLVKFRDTRAKEELLRFFEAYESRAELISKLTPLGFSELLPEINNQRERTGYSYATNLAKLAPNKYILEIQNEFENTRHETLKPELAKALYESTKDFEYLNYLKSLADVAINDYPDEPNKRKGRTTTDLPSISLKQLASIKSPEVKEYLEASLESENPVVVEIALVNLLLSHGDSPKAVNKLKEVVGDRESKVSEDTKLRLAFEVGDPEVLRVFKETYDKQYQGPSNYWWKYSNHHQYQSIYYWIDNYTVDYIEQRDRPKTAS